MVKYLNQKKGVDLGGPIFISSETYKSDFSGH